MNVKPCWKCELSNRHLIRSISPEGNLINLFQIKCDNCRYISSIGQTEAKAIESWNAKWDEKNSPPAPREVKYDYEVRIDTCPGNMLQLYWVHFEHYKCYPEFRDAAISEGYRDWSPLFQCNEPSYPGVKIRAPQPSKMQHYRIRMERKKHDR